MRFSLSLLLPILVLYSNFGFATDVGQIEGIQFLENLEIVPYGHGTNCGPGSFCGSVVFVRQQHRQVPRNGAVRQVVGELDENSRDHNDMQGGLNLDLTPHFSPYCSLIAWDFADAGDSLQIPAGFLLNHLNIHKYTRVDTFSRIRQNDFTIESPITLRTAHGVNTQLTLRCTAPARAGGFPAEDLLNIFGTALSYVTRP